MEFGSEKTEAKKRGVGTDHLQNPFSGGKKV